METRKILKAMSDETRFKILILLLQHEYCVRALAARLGLSESAISQHLKVLRDAGLVTRAKKGYFAHYEVDRVVLHGLAAQIQNLADIERKVCNSEDVGCGCKSKSCHVQKCGERAGDSGNC